VQGESREDLGVPERAEHVRDDVPATVAVWLVPTFHSLIEEQVG
jgi:hypothetical protein